MYIDEMPEEPSVAFSRRLFTEVLIFAGLAAAACGIMLARQSASNQVLGVSTPPSPAYNSLERQIGTPAPLR